MHGHSYGDAVPWLSFSADLTHTDIVWPMYNGESACVRDCVYTIYTCKRKDTNYMFVHSHNTNLSMCAYRPIY
jgi:hypothetical protein